MTPDYETLAKMIDHAILVPTTPWSDLEAGVQMAAAYRVASTCVVPYLRPPVGLSFWRAAPPTPAP